MKIIRNSSAIKSYYYLAAIDGSIQDEEGDLLEKLGKEIDPIHFDEYKDEVVALCQNNVDKALSSADSYDIISELIDEELHNQTDDPEQGITSRMLVWNLLVMSMANGEYDVDESRIIRHIVRVCEVDESVFLEMEQIIQSFVSVDNELKEMQMSYLPYAEIRPLVEELEKRKENLTKHAAQLVADEVVAPVEAYVAKEDVIDKARNAYHKATAPLFGKIKSSMGSALGKMKEKSEPVTEGVKQSTGKAWNAMKNKNSNTDNASSANVQDGYSVQSNLSQANNLNEDSTTSKTQLNGDDGENNTTVNNYCRHCGAKRWNDSLFCNKCGKRFD